MEYVTNVLKSTKLVIFAASGCRFCKDLDNAFLSLDKATKNKHLQDRKKVKLDEIDNREEVASFLYGLSKLKTIPQVFVDGKFVGDSEKVQYAINNNFFEQMLGS
eukprot:GAHX01000144.1.p1 GENE.GAHX01000144.1~~GAHX01000144.1.p1  ORF type:complete len:105 (-),score=27.35 GAHX01000144.1:49-363(-)